MNWLDYAGAIVLPVSLWVLWRIQTAAVETLRYGIAGMVKFTPRLYQVVSWFGTFLHELSHAFILLATGHGIKEFSAKPEEGHVLPRRRFHSGIGDLAFMLAAFAPMVLVPAAVMLALVLVLDAQFIAHITAEPGWDGTVAALQTVLLEASQQVATALARLDFTNWGHGAVLLVMVLAAPGLRPSLVTGLDGGSRGDIAVIRRMIRRRPGPMLALVGIGVIAYVMTWYVPVLYWAPAQLLWGLAVTGILTAIVGGLLWWLVAMATQTKVWIGWLAFATAVTVQVLGRTEWGWTLELINAASLLAWLVAAMILRLVAPRQRWKF